MPRNGSGTYTLPASNPVVAGTTIEASWANNTLADVATELTNSLSRSGAGGMTGPLRLDAGTAAVPALAWSTETTTGWYRAGTGDIRFAVATVDVLRVQSTGLTLTGALSVSGATTLTGALTLNGGIANNPTLTAGTANGVLYLDGSKVATSGSALTFDGTNFGIGTASPGAKLDVVGETRTTVADATVSNRWIATTGRLRFRPYVDATIGAFFESTNPAESAYLPLSFGGSTIELRAETTITTRVAGTVRTTLDASGNLGIGTASPQYKLDVSGAIRAQQTVAAGYTTQIFENLASNGYAQLQFNIGASGANGVAAISYAPGIFFAIGPAASDTTTPIVFRNNNGAERARLDASGNFGVGTASPSYRVHVVAATAVDVETGVTNSAGLSRYGTRASGNAFLGAFTAGKSLEFWSGSNLNATLDASGNLGLNTATFGTSAAGVLALGTGTAPTTGPADTVQLFSVDRSAGNTIPAIRCEGSGVTNAGITNTTVTNKIAVQVNGTIYYLLATTNAT